MRSWLGASALLLTIAASARVGPPAALAIPATQSRFTDLAGRGCEVEAAGLGPGEEQVKRCPGAGGTQVVVTLDRDEAALGFAWSDRERADLVLRNRRLGQILEWRGLETSRGFHPYAATVRVFDERTQSLHDRPLLAVLRVRRGEACLVGIVDAAANPDAYAVARSLADERARSFACGRDPARIAGHPTARSTELLARL